MEKINFSEQQKAVFNHIFTKNTNLVIEANAGTGKTFTIVQGCVQFMEKFGNRWGDILFLAFNKSISTEIKEKPIAYQTDADDNYIYDENGMKIPTNWVCKIADVGTMHSFGLRCLNKAMKAIGHPEIVFNRDNKNIDNDKYLKIAKGICDSLFPTISKSDRNGIANDAVHLFNLARINLLKAGDMVALQKLIDHHDMAIGNDAIMVVDMLMKKYAYTLDITSSNPVIDFTDMLILPLMYHTQGQRLLQAGKINYKDPRANIIPWYKLVFTDECQDLSRAQRELMKAAARRGRFVAVGDPHQAINGFAGANNDSFELITKIPHTEVLPLSVNYRCGKNIIKLAQGLVPEIQAHPNAIDGIVRHTKEVNINTFQEGHYEEVVDEETGEITKRYVEGDMILSRCSAPLIGLCIKLIAKGKPAYVMGKDIMAAIEALVKRSDAKTIKGFKTWVAEEREKIIRDICKEKDMTPAEAQQTPTYIAFKDKVDCILAFEHREHNLDFIIKDLKNIFDDKRKGDMITLCTCHKSKGLENQRVFILAPERLPLIWKGQLDWQYEQEENLKYVAITRAKEELVFVDIEQDALMNITFES